MAAAGLAAAVALVAAAAAALGALLMAPGLSQPDGQGTPEPRGGAAAERRRSGRMDQALLLIRNELPAPGLNLAARSGSCHQVRGCAGRGLPPASDSPARGFFGPPRGFVRSLRFDFIFEQHAGKSHSRRCSNPVASFLVFATMQGRTPFPLVWH